MGIISDSIQLPMEVVDGDRISLPEKIDSGPTEELYQFFRMILNTWCGSSFFIAKKERMVSNMKKEKSLIGGISILIGAVIAILALAPKQWQPALLVTTFVLWGVWCAAICLLPRIQRQKRRRQRQKQQRQLHAKGVNPISFEITKKGSEPVEHLLLRHVNHRISSYLRSTYADVTWEWCEKHPEKLAAQGGTGRIKVYGIPEFNYADVKLTQSAGISFDMMRIVPLSEVEGDDAPAEKIPPNKQPVDPQIWYEMQGRKVLEALIADLNSRGHSRLTLHENGDVCIKQDQEEVATEHLSGFPARVFWPRLVQVFESNGLAAEATAQGITVSW